MEGIDTVLIVANVVLAWAMAANWACNCCNSVSSLASWLASSENIIGEASVVNMKILNGGYILALSATKAASVPISPPTAATPAAF